MRPYNPNIAAYTPFTTSAMRLKSSVSMVSEACATATPVLLARLPGRSRRIGLFHRFMIADGRVREFGGRLEMWPVEPVNDTPAAGDAVRRRLGL